MFTFKFPGPMHAAFHSVTTVVEPPHASEFLEFALRGLSFAIPRAKVAGVTLVRPVDFIPADRTGHFGAVASHGHIVPALDLRVDFGISPEFTAESRVVAVRLGDCDPVFASLGLIVDRVVGVAALAADDIEPPPEFGPGIDASFILGRASLDRIPLTLLDVDRLVAPASLTAVREFVAALRGRLAPNSSSPLALTASLTTQSTSNSS